jgi:GNAT superfamily N-acetyltransferase
MTTIRIATAADATAIWSIVGPVFRAGETYTIPRNIDQADAMAYWFGRGHETFVAEDDAHVLGTYYLRANQAGGGDHVANCGYMTSSQAQGRGIARLMLEHSLARAKERGFHAMQFNFVVSTNERAIMTWEAYGFAKVGCLPLAFRHPTLGFVDAFVMYKQLTSIELRYPRPRAREHLKFEIIVRKELIMETSLLIQAAASIASAMAASRYGKFGGMEDARIVDIAEIAVRIARAIEVEAIRQV